MYAVLNVEHKFYSYEPYLIIFTVTVPHSHIFIRTVLYIFHFSSTSIQPWEKLAHFWHSYTERGWQLLSSRVQITDRFKKLMGNILSTFYKLSNASVNFSLSTKSVLQQTTLQDLCMPREISISANQHSFSFCFFFFPTAVIHIIKLFNHMFNFKVLTRAYYPVKETNWFYRGDWP